MSNRSGGGGGGTTKASGGNTQLTRYHTHPLCTTNLYAPLRTTHPPSMYHKPTLYVPQTSMHHYVPQNHPLCTTNFYAPLRTTNPPSMYHKLLCTTTYHKPTLYVPQTSMHHYVPHTRPLCTTNLYAPLRTTNTLEEVCGTWSSTYHTHPPCTTHTHSMYRTRAPRCTTHVHLTAYHAHLTTPPPPPTRFAIGLNDPSDPLVPGLPPTDSRFRPDQRLLEVGEHNRATTDKLRLEDKQRKVGRGHRGTGLGGHRGTGVQGWGGTGVQGLGWKGGGG